MSTGYYDRLKRATRPTAAELENQKRTSSQGPGIRALEERLEANEQATLDAANFLGRPDGAVPVDNGLSPANPAAVVGTPFYHQMDLSWAEPPSEDHVLKSYVRIREGGLVANELIVEGGRIEAVAKDLPATSHTFEVQVENRWGRRSGWSPAITKTPLLTAAESIHLGELAMLGRIQGQLPNTNLATLEDATKLGTDVVLASAIAVQDAAAFNLWASNAMIKSAKIGDLTVDKLLAGTFTAGAIILAGLGKLKAGQITLDSGGITIPPADSFTDVTSDIDYKISVNNNWAAMHFFETSGTRGTAITSRGAGGSGSGETRIETTHNAHTKRASMYLRANAQGDATSYINSQGALFLNTTNLYIKINGTYYIVAKDSNGFLKGV